MNTLSLLFVLFLGGGLGLQLWLYRRQARSVARHRNRVPDPFAGRISLAQHQKAGAYTLAKVNLAILDLILGAVAVLVWTLGGGLDLVLRAWGSSALPPLLAGAAGVLSVLLVQWLIDQPLTLWRTFRIEAHFGFNRTTASRYLKDVLLSLALALVLGGPLILGLLWLMERSGSNWWLYGWGLWMGFSLFLTWIYPMVIAPLFNEFTPLEEGELKRRIDGLVRRCGFGARGIFVMDGSRRSAHGNAYFTGFGRHKRIVFFDTLTQSLGVDELEAVLAHELGHFKHRHVQKGLLLSAGISLAGFWVLGWLAAQAWFYQGLGVAQHSHAAALLLFLLAAPVFLQFLTPLGTWLMRRHEHQADAYALRQTSGKALIRALVRLYQDNASTLTPDPLFSAFHDSHPPAPVRIAHVSSRMAAS